MNNMNSKSKQQLALKDVADLTYRLYLGTKDKFMKALQYSFLLVCWVYERQDKDYAQQYFISYKRVFTCRRIFRLGESINYIPLIYNDLVDTRKHLTGQNLFRLLTHISRFAFYLCDNIAICMQLVQSKRYHLMRRVSFSVLLIALICSIVHNLAKLSDTFAREASIKKLLPQLTPKQFLVKLNQIDIQRRTITYDLVSRFGDLLPTLQRMNLPQVVLRTRINKLTVGFFGLVGSISQIISLSTASLG